MLVVGGASSLTTAWWQYHRYKHSSQSRSPRRLLEQLQTEKRETNEFKVSNGLETIRVQADAIIVTPELIYRPGQVVVRDGRVVECTSNCDARADIELPGSALSAGLVNAHTHLEFSDLMQPFPAGNSFPEWIGAVIRHRRSIAETHSVEECLKLRQAALKTGYEESRQAGVALLADIVTRPWSPADLFSSDSNPRCVSGAVPIIARNGVSLADCMRHFAGPTSVFALPEIIGLDDARFIEAADWALELSQTEASSSSGNGPVWRTGLSPHAPYSIHFPTMQSKLASSVARQHVIAMHVAESLDELEWLAQGTGPFRQVFERLGVPADAPRASVAEVIQWLATRERSLLVHGNYLNEAESQQVADGGIAIVYCPRTHRHFAHRDYPLKRFVESGINVVLGTDSRASNPNLDLWNEVLLLRESHSWVSPEWAFGSVTQRAAEALGADQHFGSLLSGRSASMNISQFNSATATNDMLDELTSRSRPFVPLGDVLGSAL